MNKREKDMLLSTLVKWEFFTGGSSSEAAARAGCFEDIMELFKISEDDLVFHRTYEICMNVGIDPDDHDTFDKLYDAVEDNFRGVLDAYDVSPQRLIEFINERN